MEDNYLLVSSSDPHYEEIEKFVSKKIGHIEPYEYCVSPEWFNRMNFCGCGNPESVMSYFLKVLMSIKERQESDFKTNKIKETILSDEESIYYFVLYVLDAMGLTEHGGNVSGCWITLNGLKFIEKLKV